jgi:hypothetical protein
LLDIRGHLIAAIGDAFLGLAKASAKANFALIGLEVSLPS